MSFIFQDIKRNKGNTKGLIILVLFRLGQLLKRNKVTLIVFISIFVLLKKLLDWV